MFQILFCKIINWQFFRYHIVFNRLTNISLKPIFKQWLLLLLLFIPFVGMSQRVNLDSLQYERQKQLYKTQLQRQKTLDSIRKTRAHFTDSIKIERKKRTDSLTRVRKYRDSRRFRDSVAFVRQARIDSISGSRRKIVEDATTARKKVLDSMKHERLVAAKIIKDARAKISDSLKIVRKTKTDSLAKIKEKREKLAAGKEKQREDKKVMAFQLKIKKKREAWSNETMLKKPWGWKRRGFQNTYTHYNYYFNANRKMNEAIVNMLKKKDNFDTLLPLYPFNPNKDSTSMSADMDSVISKASLGIQIHDPRTKWGDNLYLLYGQANYYKGQYELAATAFKYIISQNQLKKAQELKDAARKGKKSAKKDMSILTANKKGIKGKVEHKPSNNDAALWLIRTYTDWQKGDDAESMIDLLNNDKNLNNNLKGKLALEKAYLQLSYGNIKFASDELTIVAAERGLPEWVRMRAAFLNGQLLYRQGRYSEASDHFQQVIDYGPKPEMDFYARKNLAYSLMNLGSSQDGATASLKHMLKEGKYSAYYEQVYFILGSLSVNNNDLNGAIAFYQKSLESPKTTRKQKAISFAGLGNAFYLKHEYSSAKAAYDSSVFLSKAAPGDSLVELAATRASVLDKITAPLKIIHDYDSLLHLASLSLKDQKMIVRKYMKYLEDQREDSIRKAELAEPATDESETQPEITENDWYFSSPILLKQGLSDFKSKWGNRPNVDNWQRSAVIMPPKNNTNTTSEETEEITEDGLPTEEYLLAAIPKNSEQKAKASEKIQKAYISLANGYLFDLKDFPSTLLTLDSLDKKFPNHNDKAEVLFLHYRTAMEKNNLSIARTYSDSLIKTYPESPWAVDISPKKDAGKTVASLQPVNVFYEETYNLMHQHEYAVVLERAQKGQRQYNNETFNNRFKIIEAIALAGSGKLNAADTLLKQFIINNPNDTLNVWAKAILDFIKKSKSDSTKQSGDTTSNNNNITQKQTPIDSSSIEGISKYTYSPAETHFVCYLFGSMDAKLIKLKNDFETYHKSMNLDGDISIEFTALQPAKNLLIIRQFNDAAKAKAYTTSMKTTTSIFKDFPEGSYQICSISISNFQKLQGDKDINAYLKFYSENYK